MIFGQIVQNSALEKVLTYLHEIFHRYPSFSFL
jgi:hypothetical protein